MRLTTILFPSSLHGARHFYADSKYNRSKEELWNPFRFRLRTLLTNEYADCPSSDKLGVLT